MAKIERAERDGDAIHHAWGFIMEAGPNGCTVTSESGQRVFLSAIVIKTLHARILSEGAAPIRTQARPVPEPTKTVCLGPCGPRCEAHGIGDGLESQMAVFSELSTASSNADVMRRLREGLPGPHGP